MKIDHTTPLHAIAELMGACATEDDAAAMRAILVRENVIDTADVSENDWLRFCDAASIAVYDQTWVGARVEAGWGDDHDTGTVRAVIRPGVVEVAWDTRVITLEDTNELRRL